MKERLYSEYYNEYYDVDFGVHYDNEDEEMYVEGCGYSADAFRACMEDMYVETIYNLHKYWVNKDNNNNN